MAVQFHHVFPGEAAGGPHQQQQGLINALTADGIHHMAVEHPVALPALAAWSHKQLVANRFRPRPRNPHDGHTALPRGDGGGHGGDGVEAVGMAVVSADGGNHHPLSAVN